MTSHYPISCSIIRSESYISISMTTNDQGDTMQTGEEIESSVTNMHEWQNVRSTTKDSIGRTQFKSRDPFYLGKYLFSLARPVVRNSTAQHIASDLSAKMEGGARRRKLNAQSLQPSETSGSALMSLACLLDDLFPRKAQIADMPISQL